MNALTHVTDFTPHNDQKTDSPALHIQRSVITFHDLKAALEDAVQRGQPSPVDWVHRAVDFRILAHVLGNLDHRVEAFGALLPDEWEEIAPEICKRIPGNPRNNHMRLVFTFKRAIGLFRPDLDPWSALQVLADTEMSKSSGSLGRVRCRAKQDGLKPIQITSAWIKQQLVGVEPQNEAEVRGIFLFLVRLSKKPQVQASGFLRSDLTLPTTMRQQWCSVDLPDWLQAIYTSSDRQTQNALDRLWRTVLYHDQSAHTPADFLALINADKLSHDAAQSLEPIKLSTWRIYIQRARKALLPVSEGPTFILTGSSVSGAQNPRLLKGQ